MFEHLNLTLTLGQADAPPPPPEGEPGAPTTEQPAGDGAVPPEGGEVQSPFPSLWLLVLLLVVMWVVLFLPQRREKKRRAAMLDAMKKNDKVQTIGGVIGTVVEVREHDVLVKVDEGSNTKMRFSRAAIQSILPDGKPTE